MLATIAPMQQADTGQYVHVPKYTSARPNTRRDACAGRSSRRHSASRPAAGEQTARWWRVNDMLAAGKQAACWRWEVNKTLMARHVPHARTAPGYLACCLLGSGRAGWIAACGSWPRTEVRRRIDPLRCTWPETKRKDTTQLHQRKALATRTSQEMQG